MREATPLPQLTIQQLDYLVAVADAPTWATAAAELGVSPSALSQGLAELERRLGMPLFARDGRRRTVATHAVPVVDYARRVLAQTGDLGRWIADTRSGRAGNVRVGMIDAAAIGHYSQTLQQFRADHRDIGFTLSVGPSAGLLEQLTNDELDLVVVVAPTVQPAGVEWTDLLEESLAVYAPPGVKAGPADRWGPWVAFPTTSHTRRLIAEGLRDAGASFEVVAESNQPEVLKEMVRLGMGWTVLPVIQAETEPGPLTRARKKPLLTRRLVAARRLGALANPLVDQLVGALESADPTLMR